MKQKVKTFIARYIPQITDTSAYWYIKIRLSKIRNTSLNIQSEYFMKKILNNVPKYVFEDAIRIIDCSEKLKIGDLGCGSGKGTKILYNSFRNSKVIGYDFAISSSFKNGISFVNANITNFNHSLDIGIISNVLEHFKYPFEIIKKLTQKISTIIILVPYKEQPPLCIEHRCSLDEYNFPEQINSHRRIFLKVINCNEIEHRCLDQLLVVYTKKC